MDKHQKSLINTYFRKRNIASKQDNRYDRKFHELNYIIKYKREDIENLSNRDVFRLLLYCKNKQEMANLLGKEIMNKLSDNNINYLLVYVNRKEMKELLMKYRPDYFEKYGQTSKIFN